MADEAERVKEEPEVEGHGFKGGTSAGDLTEGHSSGAHEGEDSEEVEGHAFTANIKETVKENLKETFKD